MKSDNKDSDIRDEWKSCLIREEFLQIYFDTLGIKDKVKVKNLISQYELQNTKIEEQCLFVIVRNDPIQIEKIYRNRVETKRNRIFNELNLKILSPKENILKQGKYSSLEFMELAYSGFLLQNADIFEADSTISNFYNQMNKEKIKKDDIKDYPMEYEKKFLKYEELRNIHNNICDEVFGNELEEINENLNSDVKKNDSKDDDGNKEREGFSSYSLFFTVDGALIEYIPLLNLFKEIQEGGITQGNMAKSIGNYIISVNENLKLENVYETKFPYYNDIFIFTENQEPPKEEIDNSPPINFLVPLISLILFLVSFLDKILPGPSLYNQNAYLSTFLNFSSFEEIENVNDFKNNLTEKYGDLLSKIFNDDNYMKNKKTIYQTSSDADQDQDSGSWDKPYLNREYLFEGLMVSIENFNDEDNENPLYYANSFKKNKKNSSLLYEDDSTVQIYVNSTNSTILNQTIIEEKEKLENITTNDHISKVIFTLMFTNLNEEITSVHKLTLKQIPTGQVEYSSYYSAFKTFLNRDKNRIIMLIIHILLIITFVLDLVRIVTLFINKIVHFNKTKILTINFIDCLDFLTLAFAIFTQSYYYKETLFNTDYFPVKLKDESTFMKWAKYSFRSKKIIYLCSVEALLMFIKLVLFSSSILPSLGLIFSTISDSLKPLSSLYVLIFLMYIGFSFLFQISIGQYTKSYYRIGDSFTSVYLLFVGIFDYDNDFIYNNQNHPLSAYLWWFFYIIFQILLFNLFLCLILYTFQKVKKEKQLFNDALFLMTKESLLEIINRIIRLLTCYDPDDNIEENPDDSDDEKENFDVLIVNKDYIKLFMRNFNALEIRRLFKSRGSSLEEFEEQKKHHYKEIRKQVMSNYMADLKRSASNEFELFKEAIYFVIFIIFFLIMIYYQTHISDRDQIQYYPDIYFKNGIFKDLINGDSNYSSFPYQFFRDFCQTQEDYGTYCIINHCPYDTYTFHPSNSDVFRVTLRFYEFSKITKSYKNKYLTYSTTEPPSYLDTNKCPYPYEAVQTMIFNGEIQEANFYKHNTKYITFNDCGGFIEEWNKGKEIRYKEFYEKFKDNYEEYGNLGSITLDFALFSTKSDYVLYISVSRLMKPYKDETVNYKANIIPINRFVSMHDFQRIVFEIIYYITFLCFFLKTLADILSRLKKYMLSDYRTAPNRMLFTKSSLLNKYYRFSFLEYKNKKGISLICSVVFFSIYHFIWKTIILVFMLIFSIINFLSESFLNILDLFSLSVCIGMIGLWFHLISITNTLNFKEIDVKSDDYQSFDNLKKINHLNILYKRYVGWQSVNVFLFFIRLLRYLKFSSAIEVILRVFYQSSLTLITYLIFFILVNLGFIIFSFGLFSQDTLLYSTVGRAINTIIILLIGKVKQKDVLYLAERDWRGVFVFFFSSLNFLIFQNILYSIIIESFNETKERQIKNNEQQLGVWQNILSIFRNKTMTFLRTSERYKVKVNFYYNKFMEQKMKMKRELYNLEVDSKKSKDKDKDKEVSCCTSFCHKLKLKLTIKRSFYEKIKQLSKLCVQIDNFDNPWEKKTKRKKVSDNEKDDKQKSKNKKDSGKEKDNKRNPTEEGRAENEQEGKDNEEIKEINLNKKEDENLIKYEGSLFESLKQKYYKKLNEEISIYHKMFIYFNDLVMQDLNYETDQEQANNTFDESIEINYDDRLISKYPKDEGDQSTIKKEFANEYAQLMNQKLNRFFHPNMVEKYYSYIKEYSNQIDYNDEKIDKYGYTLNPRFSKEANINHHEILNQYYLFMIPSVLAKLKCNEKYKYLYKEYAEVKKQDEDLYKEYSEKKKQDSEVKKQVEDLYKCDEAKKQEELEKEEKDIKELVTLRKNCKEFYEEGDEEEDDKDMEKEIIDDKENNKENEKDQRLFSKIYSFEGQSEIFKTIFIKENKNFILELLLASEIKEIPKIIYDNLIRFFYLPNFNNTEEKEMYLGYFSQEIKSEKNTPIIFNFAKKIPEYKIDHFIFEILNELNYILELSFELYNGKKHNREKNIENQNSNINKPLEDIKKKIIEKFKNEFEKKKENSKDVKFKDLKTKKLLFAFYYIWDTIYIILFNKNRKRVKEIRSSSKFFKKIEEVINPDLTKEELSNKIFIKVYSIISGFEQDGEKENKNAIKKKQKILDGMPEEYDFPKAMKQSYRNYILKRQSQIEFNQIDPEYSFYFNNDKLMLYDEPNYDVFLQLKQNLEIESPKFQEYPKIFRVLWDIFPRKGLQNLFYGYNICNENIEEDQIIGYILKEPNFFNGIKCANKYVEEKIKEFQNTRYNIYEYFSAEQRAEIINMLEPNESFMKIVRVHFEKFDDENSKNVGKFKVYTFKDILIYFKLYRINLLDKHSFYQKIFENYFIDSKQNLLKIYKDSQKKYHKFLIINPQLKPLEKIISSKFFGLLATKKRFTELTNDFLNIVKEQKKNEVVDQTRNNNIIKEPIYQNINKSIINEEEGIITNETIEKNNLEELESLKKNNPFTWILSLEPFDYLDVCQKISDNELREFYLCLYNYIYGEIEAIDSNYYLKRKIKMNFIEKYDQYLDYINEKEKIERQKYELEQKEKELKDAIEYLNERRNQFNQLLERVQRDNENIDTGNHPNNDA